MRHTRKLSSLVGPISSVLGIAIVVTAGCASSNSGAGGAGGNGTTTAKTATTGATTAPATSGTGFATGSTTDGTTAATTTTNGVTSSTTATAATTNAQSSTTVSTGSGVPVLWTCDPTYFGDGSCDCGCGVADPDCIDATAASCDVCDDDGSCNTVPDCPGGIDALNNATCHANTPENTDAACMDGIDNDIDDAVDCADSDCLGHAMCAPVTWTCDPTYWNDGTCDCGCGAQDIDCPDLLEASCDFCDDDGSCSPVTCPGGIDAVNNTSCHPNAPENTAATCSDGIDNDIDGAVDCADTDCANTSPCLAWINEMHYNNVGTDSNEGVEVAGLAGTSLTGWSIVYYNGVGGVTYATVSLSGTVPNQMAGYGTLSFPHAAIQNGNPDGVALVGPSANVIQFLSYGGTFAATNGPAMGLTSVDIGVQETDSTPVGQSLQLSGTGHSYGEFMWASPDTSTVGAINNDQTFQ